MTFFAPHMPVLRPVLAVTYETYFSNDTIGALPADWSKAVFPAKFDATVVALADAQSGRALLYDKLDGGDNNALKLDAVPDAADVEVLMRLRRVTNSGGGTNHILGAIARGFTDGNLDAYRANQRQRDTSSIVEGSLDRINNGGTSNITDTPDITLAVGAGNWAWVRLRCVGDQITFNHWAYGTTEPTPITVTNTAITAAGFTGLSAPNGSPDVYVDYFAVSVGSPPPPIPIPF